MIKTCQICGDIKPLAGFSKDRSKKDGHSNRCKVCDRKKNRKWRQDNPEKHRSKNKQWNDKNKDRRRMQDVVAFANRRAKEYGLHDKLCLSDWEEVLETHGHQCLVCGTESDITLDHIQPLSQGGGNTKDNIQPLCRKHNSEKFINAIDYYFTTPIMEQNTKIKENVISSDQQDNMIPIEFLIIFLIDNIFNYAQRSRD